MFVPVTIARNHVMNDSARPSIPNTEAASIQHEVQEPSRNFSQLSE